MSSLTSKLALGVWIACAVSLSAPVYAQGPFPFPLPGGGGFFAGPQAGGPGPGLALGPVPALGGPRGPALDSAPVGPAAAGFIAGAVVAGAMPEQESGSYDLEPWSADWYQYCSHRYRSFDARTGTVLGSDGRRHFCSPS